jgi:hypothetical protein
MDDPAAKATYRSSRHSWHLPLEALYDAPDRYVKGNGIVPSHPAESEDLDGVVARGAVGEVHPDLELRAAPCGDAQFDVW